MPRLVRNMPIVVVAALVPLASCGDGTNGAPSAATTPARESIEAAIAGAEKLLAAQRFDEAEIVAATLAERAPDAWRAQELLGRILSARAAVIADGSHDGSGDDRLAGLRHRAAVAYDAAARLAKDNAGLWNAAGLAAQWDGRPDAALEAFRAAAAIDSRDVRHPLFEAQIHLQRGELDRAAACIVRALSIRPDEPVALASRAEIARQRGDFAAALADVRAARRGDPSSVALRVAEARILRQAGRPRDGLELLLALGEARWRERDTIDEVALGFTAIGEPVRAAEAWEAACRARRGDWNLALNAAEAWLAAGDPIRADGWLREAGPAADDDPRAIELRRRLRGGTGG